MRITRATTDDAPAVESLLMAAGLPIEGAAVGESIECTTVCRDTGVAMRRTIARAPGP